MLRLPLVSSMIVLAAGCGSEPLQQDTCTAAASHLATCTGEPADTLGACDAVEAERLTALSCDEITAREAEGKADGGWHDFLCNDVGLSSSCPVERVVAGWSHTCALRSDGSVGCFGYNGYGEVGRPEPGAWITSAVTVRELSGVVELELGATHSCASLSGGEMRCWGRRIHGAIGAGTRGIEPIPLETHFAEAPQPMAAGENATCAINVDGRVHCWGYGAIGDFRPEFGDIGPRGIPELRGTTQLSALYHHLCALRDDGRVLCFGESADGRLGHDEDPGVPAIVPGVEGVTKVSAGDGHTCALLEDGQVTCWGRNTLGQLGLGTTSDSERPGAMMLDVEFAIDVAAGGDFTCIVESSGEVRCTGGNGYGELGRNTNSLRASSRLMTIEGVSADEVSVGRTHACVVPRETGGVVCWGSVGNGSNIATAPAAVSGLR